MRLEADSNQGIQFSSWLRYVLLWTSFATIVVIVWGSSHYSVGAIGPRDSLTCPDGRHSELVEASEIQFLIDSLQSSQALLDQSSLNRALDFVARLQPQRTLSKSEPEELNQSLCLTAVTRDHTKQFRSAQKNRAAAQ